MSFDSIYTAGIQKAINEKAKQRLTCDGAFGAKSQTALKVYQTQCGLKPTGIYDAATQAQLEPFIKQKFLTIDSINKAATALGVTPAHVRTVCDVESNGAGFLPDGRVKILFERHHFLAALKKRVPALKLLQLQKDNPDIINATPGGYVGNEGEYPRFLRACAIDLYSAYYATSFGLFQIMGFNHEFAGYKDIGAFVTDMKLSETHQLLAFVNFNKTYRKGILLTALKGQDWAGYALAYNGSNYKKNMYDTKLGNSFSKYSKNLLA
jgi:hypothetical protein